MGKTSQPLRILVTGNGDFQRHAVWAGLEEKGHYIHYYAPPEAFDMIVGPECWRLNEQLLPHIDEAIKVSRRIKGVTPKKGKPVEKKVNTGKKVRQRKDSSRSTPAESV